VNSPREQNQRRKFRRSGRHAAPSHVEMAAEKAGKAAPAVAVVGAIAVGPQVHNLSAASHKPAAEQVFRARLDAAVRQAQPARHRSRTYVVRSGDTLSGIAARVYGHAADWRWLYQANSAEIRDPNLIYVGQALKVPRSAPAAVTAVASRSGDGDGDTDDGFQQPRAGGPSGGGSGGSGSTTLSGTLGCSGLEALWRSAGGSPAAEVTAASIAMAESSGSQYATGAAGERGYWQINPVNGALSTYDPYGNARAAVILSHDGTDWSPWTTYTDGAYAGRC
jgi:hypothetical protein